ncbi:AraC family transcriptional regulator [Danxiaibacter flavus]|uniref:AraC family transcriptional regulator n=1 Tax=Danxiaibacter flavus TaxID=3049108 RepID=A0ABV3ZFK0_9BACT|nr:AraC family transcriptional regulator [Chitinophagaceae bacterium DXS]
MNQFHLQHNQSQELVHFPYIVEFVLKKNQTIQLGSFTQLQQQDSFCVYYIIEGKFDWVINGQHYVLYPGDTAMILPGSSIGGANDALDIGIVAWLDIHLNVLYDHGFDDEEKRTIEKVLLRNKEPVLPRLNQTGEILKLLESEIFNQEIGYAVRVKQLVEELFITIARQLSRQHNPYRNFPQTFMKLEQLLRENLAHQWTVAEMAAIVGLGNTAFTEKVKSYTGFSPLNYLINIRISEAIRLLKRADVNMTDIALDTGFYSSQHFSTTFKKLTGYTPSQFRKNNIKA